MKKSPYLTLLCACLCAALCGCDKKQTQKNVLHDSVPNDVIVANPLVADVEIVNVYSARVAPAEAVEVRARVGGYLEKSFFKKGDRVKKGDKLFEIDLRPYQTALDAANAAVEAAKSRIPLAEDNAKRAEGLYRQNAVSQEMYQSRTTEFLLAKAQLNQALAAQKNAELNLQYATVTAPISGKIGEALVDNGNLVSPATALATIVNDDSVRVYFDLNGSQAMLYKNAGLLKDIDLGRGANVEILQKDDSKKFSGKLTYRAASLGKGSGALRLRADADNRDGEILCGALATVAVGEGLIKDALMLPEEIVCTDLGGRYVITVDKENIARHTPVKVGVKKGAFVVIESGISPDSNVVVTGIQRAGAGRKVNPQKTTLKK